MEIKDKVVVVTGGGSGIGKALVSRFLDDGAQAVIASDIDEQGARRTAEETGCIAMTTDVSREDDVRRLIEDTEDKVGPIDLFCSNAGVGIAPHIDSPDAEWQTSWDVNVMSHVYAARHLLPRMRERGAGYFLITASAAGLLNQIGGAAYGTTKHAAVGLAEWLALTYAHEGIRVSALCPQAVRTPMVTRDLDSDSASAAAVDGMLEPEQVADVVVDKLREETFLILPHEEVLEYMRRKTSDYDRWLAGMNRMFRRLSGIDS